MNKPVPDLLFDHYSQVGKEMVGSLLEMLLAIRRQFSGDVEQAIIVMVIWLRTLQHPETLGIDPRAVSRGEVARYPSLLTNVRSISESTGIPYESVRRKVTKLIDAGLVERREGQLGISIAASTTFAPLRRTMFAMVESNHDVVARLLKSSAPAK